MATDQQIKTALDRARKAIELRPGLAFGTMKSSLRLEEGLKCSYTNGDWHLEIDEPESVGGDGSAPMPGTYGLAALSGCVAMSIKNLAILAGLTVDAVNLDIEADYDDHSMFEFKPIPPAGFTAFRLKIEVESNAPESEIREIVNRALNMSSWYGVFAHVQTLSPQVTVIHPERTQEA